MSSVEYYMEKYRGRTSLELASIRESIRGNTQSKHRHLIIAATNNLIDEAPPHRKVLSIKPEEEISERDFISMPPDEVVAKKYISKLANARSRGIEFTLTLADMKRLLNKKRCYFTGRLIDDTNPDSANYRTLDRLDSTKGYTKENSVVCCNGVNQLKNQILEVNDGVTCMTVKELKKFVSKL